MEKSTLILVICRALQMLCATVVIGTSANLTNFLTTLKKECTGDCDFFGIIPAVEFGIFVGAVGLIDAVAGMVSAFVEMIPSIVQLGLDALTTLCYVAGGGALAGLLASSPLGSCNSGNKCTEIKADDAFQFLAFIITLVIIGLSFMWRGKRGGGSSYV